MFVIELATRRVQIVDNPLTVTSSLDRREREVLARRRQEEHPPEDGQVQQVVADNRCSRALAGMAQVVEVCEGRRSRIPPSG